jgi:hypothetical protein
MQIRKKGDMYKGKDVNNKIKIPSPRINTMTKRQNNSARSAKSGAATLQRSALQIKNQILLKRPMLQKLALLVLTEELFRKF